MHPTDPLPRAALWATLTIAIYAGNRALYRRHRAWWLSPILAGPALLCLLAVALRTSYRSYLYGTHWLVALLGPVTVAFAIPIYEHRRLIRESWKLLAAGIVVGCIVSVVSSWLLADLFHLNESIKLSLLPRSMSTPFAMAVSRSIGGAPDLTAVFTAMTGVLGVAVGEGLLYWLPIRSTFARGALFGMGAHGAGVAKAQHLGSEEASSAGLVMVLVGLSNVLIAPWLAKVLHWIRPS
ncbi:MAG: LrgB family protein [Acidobacteriota bacterium]|nr:LrgB family protein [Acidobacteriota bacterium]